MPGKGIDCQDVLNNEAVFVMDTGLSRSPTGGTLIATRTVPLGPYWMTGGAGLPVPSKEAVKAILNQLNRGAILGAF